MRMQVLHTATLVLLTLAACGSSQPRTGGTLAAMSLDAVPKQESGSHRSSTHQFDSIQVSASDGLPSKSAEALVIQGFITARVDEVRTTSAEISERVREAGGRVVRERGTGAKSDWNSLIRVRLPPEKVDALLAWIRQHGDIESKRIEVQDVSRELFDQELALSNLTKTLARMQALLERPDLDIEAVLKIESEMSRVRGEIESLKGANRFLKDRVSYATLEFTLKRRDGVERGPETKFMTGVRLAQMSLLDPNGRARHRMGFGVVASSPAARVSYELDVFEADGDGAKRALIATMGGAAYSDHLGGGRRQFLNPYVGLRLGYGRLDGSNFVIAGEAGVELFKHRFVTIDLNVRGTSFFGSGGADVALVTAAGLSLAF